MQGYHDTLTVSVEASAAITADRFITVAGAVPAIGANVLGVARSRAADDEQVPVAALGVALVEASGAIAKGAAISTTAAGKAKTKAGAEVVVGRALEASAADGDKIQILLIPN